MAVYLPDDIFPIIFGHLADQRDSHTLFNCSISSKRLTVPALTALYRYQYARPVREWYPDDNQGRDAQRISGLWRSLALSAVDKTFFPYCRYIHSLDLRDLRELLDDFNAKRTRQPLFRDFFKGDMTQFRVWIKPGERLNSDATVEAIGEAISLKAPFIEDLMTAGQVSADALRRWVLRMPNLQYLCLFNGKAIGESDLSPLLRSHCPKFRSLMMYSWFADDSDSRFGTFISSLQPQSLQSLEVMSEAGIKIKTCKALALHNQSLTKLHIALRPDSFQSLSEIGPCRALESLHLEDLEGTIDLESAQSQSFDDLLAWMRQCKNLRDLELKNFISGAAIVTPLLSDEDVYLESLEVDSYTMAERRNFHLALMNQPNLKYLCLRGDGDDVVRDDIDAFLHSLVCLKDLRELNLTGVSDYFTDPHISHLATQLPKLEKLNTSGYGVTDRVLPSIVQSKSLREVTFQAITSFTLGGLLDFVNDLGPDHNGLVFETINADPDSRLSEDEVRLVEESISGRVGGTFRYDARDPDPSDFEGDSD
ncbi:hypothetical protein P152DRAFT_416256 [Eremomyces bilateralis CBS 781.70]|uniref:F-box domain-containing protein n=1 Tax=Eremomyces bilateralis CBS 781.70 TaxID=1392243 RepID=A0A6G1G4J0_9PEZI|nr:uncharacterized protein P152DRAFT_416256 [Eremomyces bilateralis CBS 781.70]KAF1812987.1 hypothetical protein P152DRAFT_416256 [Eremomyces bilateralis CBS 781.70]